MKFKKYLSLNYTEAIRAKNSYRPWSSSNNRTMTNITCNACICMCLRELFNNEIIRIIGSVGSITFVIMGFVYLIAFFMIHWYYVSALHYFEIHQVNSSNNKEKKNE